MGSQKVYTMKKGMRERIKQAATRAEVEALIARVRAEGYPYAYVRRCIAAANRRLNGMAEGGGK